MSAHALLAAAPGGAGQPDMLHPAGPASHGVVVVWWILFGFALFVFVVVVALAVAAVWRGRRAPVEAATSRREEGRPFGRADDRFIAVGGVVVPLIILAVVGAVTVHATSTIWAAPAQPLRIGVEGADWFWVVHEPGGITTANEVPVPVGRAVEIRLTSRDVIHSFWVPQLAPKVDMIPGQANVIRFTATRPGIYRGQCAEFCGLQHAHMIFFVQAMEPARYQAWLAQHRRPPPAPTSADARAGQAAFEAQSCAGCHTVKGTTAHGTAGPDLTYLGSRRTIGVGTLANTRSNLAAWIADSQDAKPGNRMPPSLIPRRQIDQIVDYLETQR